MNTKEVLVKFGMALFIHKEMIKQAQKGKEAVDYLKEKGVLPAAFKKSPRLA